VKRGIEARRNSALFLKFRKGAHCFWEKLSIEIGAGTEPSYIRHMTRHKVDLVDELLHCEVPVQWL